MSYARTLLAHLPSLSTDDVWCGTHSALLGGRWSEARAYLDELARRPDNKSSLCTVDTYMKDRQVSAELRDGLRDLLGDRIDLVNSKALAS